MTKSKIEWTDRTWNPVTGCTKVSTGCANCYAERWAIRLKGRGGYPVDEPFRVTVHLNRMNEPYKWRNPAKVFVCSMSDLFHEHVPAVNIRDVWEVMEKNPRHTFIILTKRPERAKHLFGPVIWQLSNVWLGVSAENQQTADERIPILLQIPAAVRFVSCEPLLGAVDLSSQFSVLREQTTGNRQLLNWVICGGESGPGARPMHPDWARSLRDQCQAANVPFFFKQWGEWQQVYVNEDHKWLVKIVDDKKMKLFGMLSDKTAINISKVGKKAAGRLLDKKEWNEFPGEVTKVTKI